MFGDSLCTYNSFNGHGKQICENELNKNGGCTNFKKKNYIYLLTIVAFILTSMIFITWYDFINVIIVSLSLSIGYTIRYFQEK